MNTDSGNYRKSVHVELEWVLRLGRNTRNKGQPVCSTQLGILSPDFLVCPILDDKYCEGSIRMLFLKLFHRHFPGLCLADDRSISRFDCSGGKFLEG